MANGLFNLKQVNQAIQQSAWTGQKPSVVNYLVVAGGGAGGGAYGGGGGGGGFLTGVTTVTAGSAITVTVGAGGTGSTGQGPNGSNSVFGSVVAIGGGGGCTGQSRGSAGGSGGGNGGGGVLNSIGSATAGQGNVGGTGGSGTGPAPGGGGGAGSRGMNGSGEGPAGTGGYGAASAITGIVTAYAGGGGSGCYQRGASGQNGRGGAGGGGAGGDTGAPAGTGVAGTANTGGGGGGASTNGPSSSGGNGGSGIVVISYPDTYVAAASTTGSPTVSTSGAGSISFNGSSQYLNYAAQTPFSFGTGDFTIEFWAYPTGGLANYPSYIDFRGSSSATPAPYIYNDNGILVYGTAGANRITYTYATLNTWVHVAVCRIGTSTKMYVNGTQVGATYIDANSYTVGTGGPYIGQNGVGGGWFTGYMSNIRVVKGVGVYTGTFTPPTAPLTITQIAGTNISAITGTQTSLLLPAVSGALSADISSNAYAVATASTASAAPSWNAAWPFSATGYRNRVYTWTSSGSITF